MGQGFGQGPTVGADAETDARIIGINDRSLNTLGVYLGTFERLAPLVKDTLILIAESDVHCREDALRMMRAGADALLVGTELMECPGDLNRF